MIPGCPTSGGICSLDRCWHTRGCCSIGSRGPRRTLLRSFQLKFISQNTKSFDFLQMRPSKFRNMSNLSIKFGAKGRYQCDQIGQFWKVRATIISLNWLEFGQYFFGCWLGHLKMSFNYPTSHEQGKGQYTSCSLFYDCTYFLPFYDFSGSCVLQSHYYLHFMNVTF